MMTELEIASERGYRNFERLGILCEGRAPTLTELFLADQDGEEWERQYRKENAVNHENK